MGLVTSSSKIKKQQEMAAVSSKIKKTKLSFSDLVIPLASALLLIVLTFAVFVPMVRSAFEYLDEIKVTKEKIEQLETLNKKIDLLDDNELNEDVLVSRQVIPEKLMVSDFIYYVDTLATDSGLVIDELSAGDTGSAGSTSGTGVSGPVGYSGAYENVIAFLDDVQNVSPYMIRLQNVEVSSKEDGTWNISLLVSGYYLLEDTNDPDIYASFQSYIEYSDIVEIFKNKAANR